MRQLAERVERVAESAETVTTAAEQVVSTATSVTTAAETVIAQSTAAVSNADVAISQAARAAADATGVLALYQPIAEKAAPRWRGSSSRSSRRRSCARAIRMVDAIPRLTSHVEADVLPLLATLDHVGPDLRELISLVTDVRNALASMPGLRLLLPRRAEGQQAK